MIIDCNDNFYGVCFDEIEPGTAFRDTLNVNDAFYIKMEDELYSVHGSIYNSINLATGSPRYIREDWLVYPYPEAKLIMGKNH